MIVVRWITSAALIFVFAAGVTNAENKFVGAKKCAMCHKAGKGGTSYAVWEKTEHAKAYQTLLGDAAKKIAKEKGLKADPAVSEECLSCHVTGGGKAKNVETSFKKEEGITCEACHGAASAFVMIHSKGDMAKSKEAGMNPGQKDAKFCETCHNEKSPTFKGFKLEEMWAKIEHKKAEKK